MALKTRVKVSEVNNLHDGRYCAGMGVEMIGFPLDASHPNFVDADKFKEIASWLAGISFVAEVNESADIDFGTYEAIDYIQTSNVSLLSTLKAQDLPLIFKVDVSASATKEELEAQMRTISTDVSFFLLESSDRSLDSETIEMLSALAKEYDIFVGFGLDKDNVSEIIDQINPAGIGLIGGGEIKVGLNDFDELADILEEIDTDEFA
ncbi:phosphoribosylanthranilate isomerase [Limibacter armeniacum]|uniref:phosphoribosylanthranilate isomerase n=1 Tax=Limibacter armeniacum TaxID=466084 RepID=UPI002FE6187C